MKLLTKELAKKFPALYSTEKVPDEKKMVVAKFFGGGSFTFYAFEANAVMADGSEVPLKDAKGYEDVQFFGYVAGVQEPGLTYMNLSQLQEVRFPLFQGGRPCLPMERDLYYTSESLADIQKRGH